jgi:hypothetical protein
VADPPRYPEPADEASTGLETTGTSVRPKIVLIVLVVGVLLFVGLHLAGIHPGH